MRIRLSALLLILLVPACAPAASAPTVTPPPATMTSLPPSPIAPLLTPVSEPKTLAFGQSYTNVHYCTDGTTPLKMTVVTPARALHDPAPVVIHLKFMPEFIQPLVERGFIVVNLDWREPPDHKLPVGVQDVKCGIRYLRANAEFYHLDPDQIGVFGCSRGGHTAAMVGVTDATDDMEGGTFGFAEQSSRVQAVVVFDGIADFRTNYADALAELNEVHGIASFDDPLVSYLSPITYATKDDPPFLLIASNDEHWRGQAKMLADGLSTQGASATYLEAENAGHCQFAAGGPHGLENMITIVSNFFEETLK